MEKVKNYYVIIGIEKVNRKDMPIIELIPLEVSDREANYTWADEDETILRRNELQL